MLPSLRGWDIQTLARPEVPTGTDRQSPQKEALGSGGRDKADDKCEFWALAALTFSQVLRAVMCPQQERWVTVASFFQTRSCHSFIPFWGVRYHSIHYMETPHL